MYVETCERALRSLINTCLRIGVLLVDQPQCLRVTKHVFSRKSLFSSESVTYAPCFIENPNTGLRFISAFEEEIRNNASAPDWESVIRNTITKIVVKDQSAVLLDMNEEMDDIDVSLSNDEALRNTMPLWRDQLGRWRRAVVHYAANIRHISKTLQKQSTTNSPGNDGESATLRDILNLQEELHTTKARSENTFQAMMSTMSIVSSEKAIQEATSVTKLTQLAFFFIPLTFVSGIFGMNLNVSIRRPRQDTPFLDH